MVERGGERGTEHGGDRGTFGRGFSSRGGGRGGPRRGRRHHGGRPRREMDTSHQARSSRSERSFNQHGIRTRSIQFNLIHIDLHPAKVILQSKAYQVVSKPLWLGWIFGLLMKSKPQQYVYFPFKTVLEKEQMIFGNKKQFVSNGFDFVQKQRNQKKRQNMFDDDEKWVRSGDHPFTKAKRSNRVVKAVKPTSKSHSTRCFKCPRISHYANKCQKQRPLVTLENENVETEPEKEDPLPIFDDFTYEPMEGLDEEQIHGHQGNQEESSSIQKTDRIQDLRTNLFEEGGNDVPWFVDHSIGADQHGDQDVLNNLTEVRPSCVLVGASAGTMTRNRNDRTRARLPRTTRHSKTHGRARLGLGHEETEDGHAFSFGRPSGHSRKRPYLYPVHPSGSDEPGHYLKGHF
uniref:CCHC-type domain-containing protein n=1 Tax=Brassica oleracea var. oleracea TaxID=109376 RepID=A0A0D3E5J4_BRAOL